MEPYHVISFICILISKQQFTTSIPKATFKCNMCYQSDLTFVNRFSADMAAAGGDSFGFEVSPLVVGSRN